MTAADRFQEFLAGFDAELMGAEAEIEQARAAQATAERTRDEAQARADHFEGEYDDAVEENERLRGRIAELDLVVADLRSVVEGRDRLIEHLKARVAELEAGQEEPPPPPPVTTVFGADAASTSLSAQARVIEKWGSYISMRQFFTGFEQVAPRDPRVGVLHCSWKPTSVDAITETAVRAACANLRPGDVVEVWHELDRKVRVGTRTLSGVLITHAVGLAMKNRFYDVVKAVRPDLLVANTLTGWEADPNNSTTKGNIDKWAEVKADILGLDCDGIHGFPYPNYDGEIATAKAFLAKFPAYNGWCVPEFGTSRNATNDASGTERAKWAAGYAAKFEAAGARYVCLYEYESTPGNAFSTSAELAAWSALTH